MCVFGRLLHDLSHPLIHQDLHERSIHDRRVCACRLLDRRQRLHSNSRNISKFKLKATLVGVVDLDIRNHGGHGSLGLVRKLG